MQVVNADITMDANDLHLKYTNTIIYEVCSDVMWLNLFLIERSE